MTEEKFIPARKIEGTEFISAVAGDEEGIEDIAKEQDLKPGEWMQLVSIALSLSPDEDPAESEAIKEFAKEKGITVKKLLGNSSTDKKE